MSSQNSFPITEPYSLPSNLDDYFESAKETMIYHTHNETDTGDPPFQESAVVEHTNNIVIYSPCLRTDLFSDSLLVVGDKGLAAVLVLIVAQRVGHPSYIEEFHISRGNEIVNKLQFIGMKAEWCPQNEQSVRDKTTDVVYPRKQRSIDTIEATAEEYLSKK